MRIKWETLKRLAKREVSSRDEAILIEKWDIRRAKQFIETFSQIIPKKYQERVQM